MKITLLVLVALLLALVVSAQTVQRFVLSWTDNSDNELGFNIYRDGAKVAAVAANIRTYTDTVTGNVGQSVCYEVSAFNNEKPDGSGKVQESAKTPKECGSILAGGTPQSPGSLAIVLSDAPQSPITINWEVPAGYKPTTGDWIALYRVADTDANWIKGNVCGGKPCWEYTGGQAKGSYVVTPPGPGQYDVRFFPSDTFKSTMKSRGYWGVK